MSKTTNGRSRGQRGGSDQRTRMLLIVAVTVAIILLIATGQQLRPTFAQTSASASGIEQLDYAMIGKIREEGLNRSEVMDHISWLTDVYGPRLTGSPAIKQASEWVQGKFTEWELSNINEEKFAFGKGWSLVRFTANMIEPQAQPLIGYPHSWTSSTEGMETADVVQVSIQSAADFDEYRGKLGGKIVLTQPVRAVQMLDGRMVLRMTAEDIAEAEMMPIPAGRRGRGGRGGGRGGRGGRGGDGPSLQEQIREFYLAEGVVATFDRGSNNFEPAGGSNLSWQTQRTDGGTVFPSGRGPRDETAGNITPGVTLAVEHYNRMMRVLDKGVPVRVELEVQTEFHDEVDMNGFNLIAEIPGTDLADEVVMIGAHFDSTHGATGATDNASGSAAMMEVMRILQAVEARPRRTIRIALWGGEEQGLIGSREYVKRHFGDRETMELLPDHAKLSAYFNIDNGAGRARGVWLQSNIGARNVFEQWIAPLADLGVTTLGPRSDSGTDHTSFDAVGLPGFQFMQDRLEYNARTHHSNMDVYDRIQREDVVQLATVAAIFAYNAAMRDELVPRKALPDVNR